MNIERIKSILTSRLVKSTGITIFGSGLAKVILMIATFICARLLTKSEFGEFSFIRNTLITVLSVCALRFGALCTKYAVEAIKSKESSTRLLLLLLFSFSISLLVGILLFILPKNVLMSIFETESSLFYFRIIGIFLPLFMIQPLIESILRGLMEFKVVAYLQIFMALFFLLSIILGIKLLGLIGAFTALIIYYLLYSLISVLLFFRHKGFIKILLKSNSLYTEKKALYTMIIPTFITSFIDAPVYWISQAILANQCNMASVGTMSAVVQLRNTAYIIPAFFFSTYMSFASKLNSTKQYKQYYSQFQKMILLFFLVGVIIFIVFSIFAEQLLSLFGSNYIGDVKPLYIANATIPFYLLFSLLNIHMVIKEHQRNMLFITFYSEFFSLLLFVILLRFSYILPVSTYFISQIFLVILKFFSYLHYYLKDKTANHECYREIL